MIFKLSMTGLKSRLKDYLVLFSGLSAASMTFYMFLTLAANQSFLKSSVVCDQFSSDWFSGPGLPVLTSVAVVRQDDVYGSGTGPADSVDHDQKFHKVVVDRRAGGLDQEDVLATDRIVDVDLNFTVAEANDA